MSYILDALRKADAQRERDPARGIHAQPLQGPVESNDGAPMRRKAVWAAGAVGLAVIAGAAWYLGRPGAPESRPSPQAQAVAARTVSPGPAPAPAPAAQVLPPPVVVARAPAIVPVQASAPVQTPVQTPPPPPAREASRAEPAPLVTAPTVTGQPPGMTPFPGPRGPGMAPVPPNTATPPPRAAAPIPPSQPMPPVQGLPPDAPKLVINGGVYSANPAQRMLIVNGQVVKEGADLGSGVKLDQITAKSAVLSFRGARYTVGY